MTQNSAHKTMLSPEESGPALDCRVMAQSDGTSRRTVRVVPFQQDHREQVLRLYREVFGRDSADSFRERWRWSQENCLYPQDTPKWVLEDRERVVGFLGSIPLPYVARGQTILAHTPCDYMVHPEYRFHGIKLMREFFRTCDNCVTCDDMAPTIKVTRWLGAHPAGVLVRHVALLDTRALGPKWGWAGSPPLRWPINLLLRLSHKARSRHRRSTFRVEKARQFDQRFEAFFHKLVPLVPMMPARDLRYLEWRYGSGSPHTDREIGVATDRWNNLVGYIIFYLSPTPGRSGYILDLQTLPSHSEGAGDALLAYAMDRLRSSGAWSVRYHHLTSPYTLSPRILKQHGFIPRGSHEFLVRFQDPSVAHLAEFASSWNYSYGDSEASHASI